ERASWLGFIRYGGPDRRSATSTSNSPTVSPTSGSSRRVASASAALSTMIRLASSDAWLSTSGSSVRQAAISASTGSSGWFMPCMLVHWTDSFSESFLGRRTMRLLLRNGLVIDTEPAPQVRPGTDVLIEDDRILAVGQRLPADGATVIDATDRIVLPGFVDTHRHLWQTALRGLAVDADLGRYLELVSD